MGEITPLTLTPRSNAARYKQAGQARLINAVPEMVGPEARAQMPVTVREGLRRRVTIAGGAIRGMMEVDAGSALALAGVDLWRIDQRFLATKVGQIAGSGIAYMARNRRPATQVAVVSDGIAWLVEGKSVRALDIPAPSVGTVAPLDATFISGYVVFTTRQGQFHWTGIDNLAETSALNFATAEGNPDGLLRSFSRRLELWLFGDRTTEVWAPTGNVDAPFQRLGGGLVETGMLAPASLQSIRGQLFWIADDGTVVTVASGYQAERISTHFIARMIQDDPNPSSIRSLQYVVAGHPHYILTGSTFTISYDLTTQAWLERTTLGRDRWIAGSAIGAFGMTIAGDIDDGSLYEVREDEPTDGGIPIDMRIILPAVHASPRKLAFDALHVDAVTGVGSPLPASPADIDPVAGLRWSDDGGTTWSPQRKARLGAAGSGVRRVRFNQLGQSRESGRTFEISVAANVARQIVAVSAEIG